MEVIIGLVVIVLGIASFILPWVLRARVASLQEQVDRLQTRLDTIDPGHVAATAPAPLPMQQAVPPVAGPPTYMPAASVPAGITDTAPVQAAPRKPSPWAATEPQMADFETVDEQPARTATARPAFNFEQQFGARLPVWIGAIALALAGFFFVKYSIEAGLLSPAIRTILGIVFGTGLMAAGILFRAKSNVANNGRIGQALIGAGIADLYICIFAATNLYYLVTPAFGFVGMALVTALAVLLSLRHGAPIAVLGLVGGFLTPVLIQSTEPDVPMLFAYLYAVIAGLFVVIRKQQWWGLALPTVLGAFLWAGIFIFTGAGETDNVWLAIFVAAVAGTVVATSNKALDDGPRISVLSTTTPALLNYISLAGAVLLSGFAIAQSQLGLLEWGLFALLSVAGLALAAFNERVYSFVPWLGAGITLFVLSTWNTAELSYLAVAALVFATLYGVGGYLLMWRAQKPVSLAGVSVASVFGFYIFAYMRLDWLQHNLLYTPYETLGAQDVGTTLPVWGMLGGALALIGALCTKIVHDRFKGDEATRQQLMAVFILGATACLTTGLGIEFSYRFLAIALMAEALAMALLALRYDIRALRAGTAVLGALSCLALLPDAVFAVTRDATLLPQGTRGTWRFVVEMGLPALLAAGTAFALRRKADGQIARWYEGGASVLGAIALMTLVRYVQEWNIYSFTDRGVLGVALFAYAAVILHAGRRYARTALVDCGQFFVITLAFATYLFAFITDNPLFSAQQVGTTYVFNALMLVYALPAVFIGIAMYDLKAADRKGWLNFLGASAFVFAFAFVTLAVRQYYHGASIQAHLSTTNAEIYTYSVVWLAMGAALLGAGMATARRYMRLAGLALVTFTVAKVFLYDASELTGLYRVISFLGLGLSLLGLSWFYTRFIHRGQK